MRFRIMSDWERGTVVIIWAISLNKYQPKGCLSEKNHYYRKFPAYGA